MDARIVAHREHQPAVDADIGQRHEGVGGDVEADMLHRRKRAAAGEGRADRDVERDLFVGRPLRVQVLDRIGGEVFQDFGAGRAGIGGGDLARRLPRRRARSPRCRSVGAIRFRAATIRRLIVVCALRSLPQRTPPRRSALKKEIPNLPLNVIEIGQAALDNSQTVMNNPDSAATTRRYRRLLRAVRELAVVHEMHYRCCYGTHPLSRIIGQFKREPSRTGSLIITVLGDAIVPRGGSVWLGTLLRFFAMLDIDGGVVRTAMSRLAADGWLERDKVGRNSFYRLAGSGRETLRCRDRSTSTTRGRPTGPGGFELLLIGNGADRDAAREALTNAGFGSPLPGVWVAPSGVPVPEEAAGAIRLEVSAEDDSGRRLLERELAARSHRRRLSEFHRRPSRRCAAWIGRRDALAGRRDASPRGCC